MAAVAYPLIAEIIGRTASLTQRAESNAARRQWKVVYDVSPTSLPDPQTLAGLPRLGDAHPVVPGVFLKTWEITEEEAGAFVLTATYAPPDEKDAGGGGDEEDETVEEVETARECSGGESSKDLTADAVTGEAVLLPTGEPFESVPTVSVSTMTFSVTRKCVDLDTDALAANCTVNAQVVTIDGITVAKHCGRLTVSTRRIYDSLVYKWEITFSVNIVSNPVKLTPDGEVEDIGHDVALLLSGFKYYHRHTQGDSLFLVKATEIDEETGEENPASAPVLLTPTGEKYTPAAAGQAYYKRYSAIKEATWSAAWFR